jgi:long-chain acyl-CoA synthetase
MLRTPIAALHYRAGTIPNGITFIVGDDIWSNERLAAETELLARGLARRGIRSGDRVALHVPNRAELAVALYACIRIGAIAVPLNNRFKTAELKSPLTRLEPALTPRIIRRD